MFQDVVLSDVTLTYHFCWAGSSHCLKW